MKIFLLIIMLAVLTIPFSASAQTQSWYFPIGNYAERGSYKMFDQYFDKNSYVGKESLFPTQYTGYHAATDWEILSGEENTDVPIYAVTDGKISFIGPVGGYGGVILLNLANDSYTAIYGHVKLSSSSLKAGDSVKAGQFLANLGKGFSSETGGERKHLHFGIYNGKGNYFKGYESSQQAIQSKWIDPIAYLKNKGAKDVSDQLSVDSLPAGEAGGQKGNSNQNSTVSEGTASLNNDNSSSLDVSTSQQNNQNILKQGLIGSIMQYLKNLINRIKSI